MIKELFDLDILFPLLIIDILMIYLFVMYMKIKVNKYLIFVPLMALILLIILKGIFPSL